MVLAIPDARKNFTTSDSDIYPSNFEILGGRRKIEKNITSGPYKDIEHYKNLHFSLLREDFISPLRTALSKYRKNPSNLLDKIEIHRNVTITRELSLYQSGESFKAIFDEKNLDLEKVTESRTNKRFLPGALVIFTRDEFKHVYLAKIVDVKCFTNLLELKFVRKYNLPDCSGDEVKFSMLEYGVYFEPYYQVLKALKNSNFHKSPLERYIIKSETQTNLPNYLKPNSAYRIDGRNFRIDNLKRRHKFYDLNPAQTQAFKSALTQEFCVIQGPPGTGKTFLGLKIVTTLIENSNLWYNKSPILVVSHKNHALDQFLEGLLPITKRIARVGRQSESEMLKNLNLSSYRRQFDDDDVKILQNYLVLGMTTTCAARLNSSTLEQLRCPIVVVEEAAEVLEAHVVASLTRHCQHLILLGDHKQLKPSTADHNIGNQMKLGISLFERMVTNGLHCCKLNVQHRMRPEISTFVKTTTYPFLIDHTSVKDRPKILGVDKNVYFVHHENPEKTALPTSKKNLFEARFVLFFAKHLILNGYREKSLAILTTYRGQVELLKEEAKKFGDLFRSVRISTLDGYQGEEADVVLLSLVRNNRRSEIGFLRVENRICVAMSRARDGFYVFGNINLLCKKSKIWRNIRTCLEAQNSIGPALKLRCAIHQSDILEVRGPKDFEKVPDGGCSKKCDLLLPCGHKCRLSCHPLDTDHKLYKCLEACQRNSCESHKCGRLCHEECHPCTVMVNKKFECGHEEFVVCSVQDQMVCPNAHDEEEDNKIASNGNEDDSLFVESSISDDDECEIVDDSLSLSISESEYLSSSSEADDALELLMSDLVLYDSDGSVSDVISCHCCHTRQV